MNFIEKLKQKRAEAVARREGRSLGPKPEAARPDENAAADEGARASSASNSSESTSAAARERIYRQARSWEASQVALYEKSEAKAWRCAKLVSVLCCLLALAIVFMMPLKQTLPYVIEVDKTTGMSKVIDISDRENLPVSEIMDKYWISEYVKARETYDWRTVDLEYTRVREMSMPNIFDDYAKHHGNSEGTMEMTLRDSKVVRVEFISIIPAGEGIATVRFIRKVLKTAGFEEESRQYLQATLGYEYDPTYIVNERRRIVNPFGFKVTSYRVDEELR